MCAKPVLITKNQKVNIGDQVLASSLFDTFDADGDAITLFRFQDLDGSANGSFYNDGTQVTGAGWFQVTAAELTNLYFHAAAGLATDSVRMQIYDGSRWSNIANFGVYTGTPNLLGPNLTVQAGVVVENETLDLHSMLTYSDPNNDPVVRFKAKDNRDNTGIESGYFVKNGVRQLQKEWFYFTTNDDVYYVAAPGKYQEGIQVRAFDGVFWTNPVNSNILTNRNVNRPVASYLDSVVRAGELTRITDLIEAYDEDGNTIKSYSFRDTHNLGGSLIFNNQVITPKTWLTVSASQLDQVYFLGAESTFHENLFFRVNDGKHNSNLGRVALETVAVPELEVTHQLMDDLTNMNAGSTVSKADLGPAYTRMNVAFTSEPNSTGYFQLFGSTLSEDVIYEFTPAEFNSIVFRSGNYEQPSLNNMLVRAYNDSFWSDWERVEFKTEAEHLSSLLYNYLSGTPLSWEQFLTTTDPIVISYSFFNVYEPGYEGADVTADNFVGFDVQMRVAAREWLSEIESFAKVDFVEVASDSISPYGHLGGIIRFGSFYLEDTDYAAFAYTPSDPFENPLGGDIWINHWASFGFQAGQTGYSTMGHEVGHAMGLKHPHEAPATLPNSTDNEWHTIMTYNQDRGSGQDFGAYDLLALQELYGANDSYNLGNDVYSFAPAARRQIKTIWDAGGNDTLDFSGYSTEIDADIRQGGMTQVLGFSVPDAQTGNPIDSENFTTAFGTDMENFISGSGNDTITGNNLDNILEGRNGNDTITGLGGDDTLRGGLGDDVYMWGLADGRDTIDEEFNGSFRDQIIIDTTLAGIDDLTEDLSFSRLGYRDLLIDLTIDGGESIGSIMIDYQLGASRVETLTLAGMAGGDLDIDLTTFIATLDSNPVSMVQTGSVSTFGNIIASA